MKKSFSFKLNIITVILLFFIFISTFYTIFMLNKTQEFAQKTGKNWLPSVNLISEISENFGQISRRHILIIGNYLTAQEKSLILSDKNKMSEFINNFENKLNEYALLASDAAEKKLYENLINSWINYKKTIVNDIKFLEENKNKEIFESYTTKTTKLFTATTAAIEELSKYNAQGAYQSTNAGAHLTNLTVIVMLIILSFAAAVTIFIFIDNFKSLKFVTEAIKSLKQHSNASNGIANELSKSSQELSHSATEQSESVHKANTSVQGITNLVQKTADNAEKSTNVATNASFKADDGLITMNKLVTAMESIQDSNAQLQNIATIIDQINTKTTLINDIVSKTEMLSLNASIESARAGEYGKGFAVVAEEVGKLAKMSGKSANDIQELITSSKKHVDKILERTKDRVEDGKKVTAEAQAAFQLISNDIKNMSTVIQEISDAAKEQENGVKKISTALQNIDHAIKTSNAAVNATSEAAEVLLKQTLTLDLTTNEIELLVKGKS